MLALGKSGVALTATRQTEKNNVERDGSPFPLEHAPGDLHQRLARQRCLRAHCRPHTFALGQWEAFQRLHGHRRVVFRQLLCALQPLRPPHQLQRALRVTRLRKFARANLMCPTIKAVVQAESAA